MYSNYANKIAISIRYKYKQDNKIGKIGKILMLGRFTIRLLRNVTISLLHRLPIIAQQLFISSRALMRIDYLAIVFRRLENH